MEETNPQIQQTPPQQAQTPIPQTIEPTIEEKEIQIAKKKRKFKKVVIVFLLLIFLGILPIVGLWIYKAAINKRGPSFKTNEQQPVVVEEQKEEEKVKLLDNPDMKIKFRYPKEAVQFEKRGVYYSPENIERFDENALKEGYIFKVTKLDISGRKLEEIAEIKKQSFKVICPKEASFSATTNLLLDGINSKSFRVFNCNGDLKVTYSPRFGSYYEIVQIFRGNLGYKQQYETATEEILQSFSFYPEEGQPITEFVKFESANYGFSFEYPRDFNTSCCTSPKPIDGKAELLVTFGRTDENAVGVYVDKYFDKTTFDEYIERQKELLIADYKIVNSVEPVTLVENVTFGETKGVALSGYSWQGNDYLYVEHPDKPGVVIVLSVKQTPSENFKDTLLKVLSSFKFF